MKLRHFLETMTTDSELLWIDLGGVDTIKTSVEAYHTLDAQIIDSLVISWYVTKVDSDILFCVTLQV